MEAARWWGVVAGILACLSVALGAFGAHALKDRLTQERMAIFETAVEYQFLHSLALLIVSVWMRMRSTPALTIAATAFLVGIVIFCGSLYLLVTTQSGAWGAVTPIGGVAFLVGWLFVIRAALSDKCSAAPDAAGPGE
jgi:uncharacterized membrane protein YgdD (TMEM256/DUF423 family)